MNLKPSAVAIAAACLCGLAQNAQAVDWKFSGFGTVGAVHSTEKQADFTSAIYQPEGSGHSMDWSTSTDTKAGAQIDAKFSPQWSATVQGLSKYHAGGTWEPQVRLGFVKYAPGAGVEVRLGRVPYAAFLVSDYLNIGYSQPWVRPPLEVYDVSFDYVDGGDVTWRTSVGEMGLKAQVMAGSSNQDQNTGMLHARGFVGFNLTADVGDMNARLSYIDIENLSLQSPAFNAAFVTVRNGALPFVQPDPAAADEYEFINKRAGYFSFGMTYDPGTWFVTGEYGRLKRVAFSPAANEFYVTGGIRMKAFTPYLSVGQFKHVSQAPSTSPIVRRIVTAFSSRDQRAVSVGTRWDFNKSMDLKVQLDRVTALNGSALLANVQPGYQRGQFSVLSVAVDFVF